VLGGTFSSLYCSLTIKLEIAPLAVPRIARAPSSWPAELRFHALLAEGTSDTQLALS
jgi:hypothetical protein